MKRKPPPSLPLFDEPRSAAGKSQARQTMLPKGLDADGYEMDPDGYPREIVGAWAKDKQARLARYVQISAPARRKWLRTGASYIDLFCGPGRCRIKQTDEIIDGSPLVAWRRALSRNSAFTHVVVSDAHRSLSLAAEARLKAADASVNALCATAEDAVEEAIASVPRDGLHLAFLDPFDLSSLPFSVIARLAQLERMDILVHVSLYDLTRNLRRYIQSHSSPLDVFMPGWRETVDVHGPDPHVRSQLFSHWRRLLQTIGMTRSEAAELVTGPNEQPLYWLAFAARHPLALRFWEDVRGITGQLDYLRSV